MEPSRIQAVDHVQLDAPNGAEESLRWFYGELVGLDEVPAGGDGAQLRFRSARIELRFRMAAEPTIDPVPVRVTIAVRSLFDMCEALDEAGLEYERISGLTFTDRRLHVCDPAGNRVALRQSWDFGPL